MIPATGAHEILRDPAFLAELDRATRGSGKTAEQARRSPVATLKSPTCGRVKIPQGRRQERVDC